MFSEDGSGDLDFFKFVRMFEALSPRASADTKTIWAFALFDFDGDDHVGPSDIEKALQLLTDDRPFDSEGFGSSDHKKDRAFGKHEGLSDEDVAALVAKILEDECDADEAGLGFSEFQSIVTRMPNFLEQMVVRVA